MNQLGKFYKFMYSQNISFKLRLDLFFLSRSYSIVRLSILASQAKEPRETTKNLKRFLLDRMPNSIYLRVLKRKPTQNQNLNFSLNFVRKTKGRIKHHCRAVISHNIVLKQEISPNSVPN